MASMGRAQSTADPSFVPLGILRLSRRVSPSSAYEPPDPGGLAAEIVAGKRELDRLTRNDLSGVSAANRSAAPAVPTPHGSFLLERHAPLPLPDELSHRLLDGDHLWIAVQEGAAIVLNEDEHVLFLRFRDGLPPAAIEAELGGTAPAASARVGALIGRLAVAGFLRGIEGYTDAWQAAPRRFMRLHLTQRCNLSCVHCYADSSPLVSATGELPVERWLQVIDDFADAGGERVLFTGGEALVYPGCERLLERAHARGLEVTLFSNGILVRRHLDAIRAYVDQVQISIDGPDEETNDPIRGAGSFRHAKEAVDLLVAAGVRVRIGIVVMQQNWRQLKARFVTFARQWEGRGVEFRLGYGLTHHGRGEDIDDHLDINETRPLVERLMEEVEGPQGPRIARSTKGCGYAEQIVIAPDGTVHPCHLLDGAITHIDDQPLAELVGVLMRHAHEYDVDHTVGCNRCDIRNLCGGTCRIQNGKSTGNRRITNCTASDKLQRLYNLVRTFRENDAAAVPAARLAPEWE